MLGFVKIRKYHIPLFYFNVLLLPNVRLCVKKKFAGREYSGWIIRWACS